MTKTLEAGATRRANVQVACEVISSEGAVVQGILWEIGPSHAVVDLADPSWSSSVATLMHPGPEGLSRVMYAEVVDQEGDRVYLTAVASAWVDEQ